MDIKQLRALLAVAETGSVTRAAETLHIVQPAVSRHLKLLEEDIGATLFDRSRQGMGLTEAGEILVEYARRALHELDRARSEIQPDDSQVSGVATIGLLPSTSALLAGPLVSAIKARYPAIRLRITVGYAGHLQRWLEAGEIDTALLYNLKATPTIHAEALLEESLCVVGPPSSALDPARPVTFAELAALPVVLTSAPHGIRSLLEQACREAGVTLGVVAETNSMDVQKTLVASGHGYTVLPAIAVGDDVARGQLRTAPLCEPVLQRKIVLALPNTRRMAVAVRCATGVLVEEMKLAVERGAWPSARWLAQ
ncbi:LysR family transcriptional regulator [Paraburkholderia unamae]|uniref:LysR family transcriptional regulator n=1 Tax=Paraburkholderia unamae TaxID=219649 RepID=A0ABX5KB65_9BURK|nr:LysR substrate-binding domain-containing protein [Paraburkholderia unamae]PVX72784.1 LysR family transcriptional regulator [Paraburkholderia unamae]CAG9272460.1 LysR family transcriptional regulator [Paraburkholderia unamae]